MKSSVILLVRSELKQGLDGLCCGGNGVYTLTISPKVKKRGDIFGACIHEAAHAFIDIVYGSPLSKKQEESVCGDVEEYAKARFAGEKKKACVKKKKTCKKT